MDVTLLIGFIALALSPAPEESTAEPAPATPDVEAPSDPDIAPAAEPSGTAVAPDKTPPTALVEPAAPAEGEIPAKEGTPTAEAPAVAEIPEPTPTETAAPQPSPPPPPAEDIEAAPITRKDEPESTETAYNRRGTFFSAAIGVGHCGATCAEIAAAGFGRLEAGYRFGHLAIGASGGLGISKVETSASDSDDAYGTADASGSMRFGHFAAIMQFFPATTSRFDPYVQVGFGFHRYRDKGSVRDGPIDTYDLKVNAPGVLLGAGVPLFLNERTALGLRFDKTIPFAGKICVEIDGMAPPDQSKCEAWSKLTSDANAIDRRYFRLDRERPWSVSLEIRTTF